MKNKFWAFVRYQRKKHKLTQKELALKAGVGLRFVRDLEQGKRSLQVDKLEQVLGMFGFELVPYKPQLDAYQVFWEYINKPVLIILQNKIIKQGVLIKEIIDKKENKIVAWQFLSDTNRFRYESQKDPTLIETLLHADLKSIQNLS